MVVLEAYFENTCSLAKNRGAGISLRFKIISFQNSHNKVVQVTEGSVVTSTSIFFRH